MRKAALFFSFVFLCVLCRAADIQSIGVPYVQNYTKAAYQAGNQNWSVTRDERGIMYFGNSDGLLAFDGRYWQTYQMPNRMIVRAVAADGKGKVYAGGFGEFGYWSYIKGKLSYKSLVDLIPEKYRLKDEIWKIYVSGNKVIFQSFASIFIFQNGKISVVKAEHPYLFLFKSKDRFFVEVISQGLYELVGSSLKFIEGSSILKSGVLSILPFDKNSYLIGTAKQGLFIFDENGIRPWQNRANEFLKTYQLNNGAVVLGKYFAFGTILNGVVIVDKAGNFIQRINKASGLQNNTVLSLFTDQQQNLWTGLDNGIDRIEINSPLYFYFDKTGKFGTVYSSIIYGGKIYLGTNQGLFYSNWNSAKNSFQTFDFNLIPNSQGQVWDLSVIDGQLICGHNDGTFLVKGTAIEKISTISGGWTINKLNTDSDLLVQGTYTGLVVFKKNGSGAWEFSHKIKNFGEPSRYVEQDIKGNIWVSHAYKGLYKLTLSDDLTYVKDSKLYDNTSGLPGSYHVNTFNLDGRVVFSSDSGFYAYDELSDKFLKYSELNKKLGSYNSSNKIIRADAKKYWFIDYGKVALVDISSPGNLKIDSTNFSVLNGRMVKNYENISRINNSIYLISVDDGFVIFDNGVVSQQKSRLVLPGVIIRRVENTTERSKLVAENGTTAVELPYKSSIRISFALPFFTQQPVRYQYYLKGYSQAWSELTAQTQKEFTNLNPGDYTFRVRALVNGTVLSKETDFDFTIATPWYSSIWAIIFYLILAAVILYLLRQYTRQRFLVHQKEIETKLEAEKADEMRREAVANEQQIIRIKNEQLQAELESKSRELTNSAMNIVYKNELLQKLSDEVDQLKDDSGKKLSEDKLRKIHKVIDDGMSDERDWNLFENSFNETHESFFKKLKANHPDLVPNDLKLCAYLRMNMSSKEIASLLNITVRGVEIRRYRLRKKLDIPASKNLSEFLIEL